MKKLRAKFTDDLKDEEEVKPTKEDVVGKVIASEIREGRKWVTVRYPDGDVSGWRDDFVLTKDNKE